MPNEYSQARRRVSHRSAELQLCALRATATARLDLRAQGGRGLPYPFSVAQIVNLSVSAEIVAPRDDFS